VFIVGPFIGSALAALVYQVFKIKCNQTGNPDEAA